MSVSSRELRSARHEAKISSQLTFSKASERDGEVVTTIVPEGLDVADRPALGDVIEVEARGSDGFRFAPSPLEGQAPLEVNPTLGVDGACSKQGLAMVTRNENMFQLRRATPNGARSQQPSLYVVSRHAMVCHGAGRTLPSSVMTSSCPWPTSPTFQLRIALASYDESIRAESLSRSFRR